MFVSKALGEEGSSEEGGSVERVRGILYKNEEALEKLRDAESDAFYVKTTPEELSELSDLECFVDDFIHSKGVKFASRWSYDVDVFVEIDVDEDLRVELKQVVLTGEAVTNDVVRDFAQNFRSDIRATFDPMAEEHDEPYLSVEPW